MLLTCAAFVFAGSGRAQRLCTTSSALDTCRWRWCNSPIPAIALNSSRSGQPGRQDFMAEIKFSCPQCGQHLSCEEAWGGHSIECPACHTNIMVPQVQAPPPVPAAPPAKQPATGAGARLAAGVTQVARSTAHAPVAPKRAMPRPPPGDNSLLKFGVIALVVAVVGGAGYFYGLPLISRTLQQGQNPTPSQGANSSAGRATGGGPMGEVSEAMDISDTLDSGSGAKARLPSGTNNPARPRPAAGRR